VTGGLAGNTIGQIRNDQPASATGNQYLVEFKGARIPDDLPERIAALGGNVIDTLPELRVALVADLTDDAAAALAAQSDVADVTEGESLPPEEPDMFRDIGRGHVRKVAQPVSGQASVTDPTTAIAYPYQWNMRAIKADQAWAAGYLGSPDVRIAIIDSGIDPTHPDLADLIDHSRSISFCSTGENNLIQQEFPGYPPWTDLSGHGTWVASIAASKGVVTAGVTSQTTLMAIKRGCTVGPFPGFISTTVRALVYAADNGADVINMSIGQSPQPKRSRETGGLIPLITAVRYALQNGVSAVVVGAGNDAIDLDHNFDDLVLLCDIPGVICVSATGPTDFGPQAQGPWVDIDAPAFYTNIGRSAISVAAPGGNLLFDPPCRGTLVTCLSRGNVIGVGLLFAACATTDRRLNAHGNLVPGPCSRNGFLFIENFGTSAAAPHVAGLAALLVGKIGRGNPAQIRSAIKNSADDLGKPGVDPFYGHGRINVARALGIQ
jgi:subtilisin family serine protease